MTKYKDFKKGNCSYNSLPEQITDNFESINNKKADFFLRTSIYWQEPNLIHRSRFLINENDNLILGFFSLTFARIKIHIPNNNNPIYAPFLWISNFAVNRQYEDFKKNVEEDLIKLILIYAESIHKLSGCRFIIFEIIKEEEFFDELLYDYLISIDFTKIEYKISSKSDFKSKRHWNNVNLEALILDLRKLFYLDESNIPIEQLWG